MLKLFSSRKINWSWTSGTRLCDICFYVLLQGSRPEETNLFQDGILRPFWTARLSLGETQDSEGWPLNVAICTDRWCCTVSAIFTNILNEFAVVGCVNSFHSTIMFALHWLWSGCRILLTAHGLRVRQTNQWHCSCAVSWYDVSFSCPSGATIPSVLGHSGETDKLTLPHSAVQKLG